MNQKRNRQRGRTTKVTFSAALIDMIALPLMIALSVDSSPNTNRLPKIEKQSTQISESPAILIELTSQQLPKLEGKEIAWSEMAKTLSSKPDSQTFAVKINTLPDGNGPIEQVLQLTEIAKKAELSSRMMILTESRNAD